MADRVHLLLYDVLPAVESPALRSRLEASGAGMARKWAAVFPPEPLPEWYGPLAGPGVSHSCGGAELIPHLRGAFRDYLGWARGEFLDPVLGEAEGGSDTPEVRRAKEFFRDTTPGRIWMERHLGEEFSTRFLRDWHYGPN